MNTNVKNRISTLLSLIAVVLFTATACEKDDVIPDNSDIYFPVGRISVMNNQVTVKNSDPAMKYEIIYDNCGGYWIKLNSSQCTSGTKLVVDFTRTSQQTEDFTDSSRTDFWLKPSYYIDWDNETIVSKAKEVTDGLTTRMDKALKIQRYVIANFRFDPDYRRSFEVKASQTMKDAFGTCMNFSRIFVALCRAAGVPARTIWGNVYNYDDNGIYDYHHQWAEVCDDNGVWHTCDLNYTRVFFNNNMKYLDLIYGPEENSMLSDNAHWAILLKNLKYKHNYPITTDGRLGFQMIEDLRPDSMVVEYVYGF